MRLVQNQLPTVTVQALPTQQLPSSLTRELLWCTLPSLVALPRAVSLGAMAPFRPKGRPGARKLVSSNVGAGNLHGTVLVVAALLTAIATPTSAQTWGPTADPTAAPTCNMQGAIACGDTRSGNTATECGQNVAENRAPDHFYSFTALADTSIVFDACASTFDTWLRVLSPNMSEVTGCDDCGGCDAGTRTRLRLPGDASALPPGDCKGADRLFPFPECVWGRWVQLGGSRSISRRTSNV